jgi:aspartyl-tRNA synthetase
MCEFYQVDLEMSFVEQEDVMHVLQQYSLDVAKNFAAHKTLKFGDDMPRISYQDAMNNYGIDRPDLRFDMKISDLTDIFT